ncbi:secondary thiamine-phosphate synthase enzyme YjbQ [Synechococcus sp. MIT S1220]|uniref:secondary thiamine-phosphate synthase enzyme YjbQ n=1 Tax=Synechococcus sp. MIT S1220 TaxID=3082549 RepID=UPI0039B0DB51
MALAQRLHQLEVSTTGAGFSRLNELLNAWIAGTGIQQGVLHLTCLHTSASLTINENADPRVLKDLQAWMDAVVPQDGRGPTNGQGQRLPYLHDDEGNDDMPAHIRTALTSQTLSLSVDRGRMLLGIWQGIYLWEHRAIQHNRRIACHLIGELQTAKEAEPIERNNRAQHLQRRNGNKLNAMVQSRHNPEAWATDGGVDTDVDLLVDRLHDLAEHPIDQH